MAQTSGTLGGGGAWPMTRTWAYWRCLFAVLPLGCALVSFPVACGSEPSTTASSSDSGLDGTVAAPNDDAGGDSQSAPGDGNRNSEAQSDAANSDSGLDGGPGDAPAPEASVSNEGGTSCPSSCPAGQTCVNGACACPSYQVACDGGCVAASADPDNCGGCGMQCSGVQLCSAGACVAADAGCLSGLQACARACVDPNNDSQNCGGCGKTCNAGTGCAGGTCVPSLTEFDAGAALNCPAGGPPIIANPEAGAAGCAGNMAQVDFRWALCSCTNLDISAPLTTDGYDSTKGPPRGGLGGNVGCDDAIVNWSSRVSVGGDLWAADSGVFMPSGPGTEVRQDLHLGGNINASSPFVVDQNAYVTGTVSGVIIDGGTSHPASIPPPCDCAPSQLVPVAAIVAAHAPPNNDDALIGLDPNVVASGGGPLRIDLPCGSFYLGGIKTSNPLTIFVHGHTAIYIAGDVVAGAPLAFQLDPTATLDIFVSGTITTSQLLTVGSPNYPALCRLYVGGSAKLSFSQNANIGCNLYAAESVLVDWSATSAIYGAIFAGSFKASHDTSIHYDLGVLSAGRECPASGPGSGGDAGGRSDGGQDSGPFGDDGGSGGDAAGPPLCSSCRDCANQACIQGVCGNCSQDSDCCAPLRCLGGTCAALYISR